MQTRPQRRPLLKNPAYRRLHYVPVARACPAWIWLAYGPGKVDESGKKNSTPAPAEVPAVATSLGWLAIASVPLSALWLPGVRESLTGTLSIALPRESATLIGTAIAAVVVGALTGRWIAVRMPTLGHGDFVAPVADWWRLPVLIDLAVTTPRAVLARALARFDDVVIDAAPQAIGQAGARLAARLAQEDNRVVDRGVGLTTAFVGWLSRATSRVGELVADGVALGPARLVSLGGQDAQRLQTGLSHHAFAVLLLGAVALGAFLFAARL